MGANAILSASIERGFQFTFSDLTASQSIASGDVVQIGESLLAIAVEIAKGATLRAAEKAAGKIASPDRCACLFVHEDVKIACLTTDVIAAGNRLYYDVANTRMTLIAHGNIFAGYAVEASDGSTATVQMHFDGRLGMIAQTDSGISDGIVAFSKPRQAEVEVETLAQAIEAAKTRVGMIMLDNFSPAKAKKVIRKIRRLNSTIKIELSGGITQHNLHKYARVGADVISMGSLSKDAAQKDFSLEIVAWR